SMKASSLTLLPLLVGAASMGCGGAPADGTGAPEPTNGSYSVAIVATAPYALPKCTSALAGTVAYVTSPSSLWTWPGGIWFEIRCTLLNAGAVAFASSTQTLVACASGAWSQVVLPQGPAGAPGAPGPQGPAGQQGDAGQTTLIVQTPEAPGANCPNGGTKV